MLLEVRTVQNFKLINGLSNLSILGGLDNRPTVFFVYNHPYWSVVTIS